MSRVITFSRFFPAYHPRKGEETFFVEKIWSSLKEDFSKTLIGLDKELENFSESIYTLTPKYHTIRAGNRWKVGDKFSPRVWSDKPYRSKQITIAPDIEIKKVWSFEIKKCRIAIFTQYIGFINGTSVDIESNGIINNDGLNYEDFCDWFKLNTSRNDVHFKGQIICWNENINY